MQRRPSAASPSPPPQDSLVQAVMQIANQDSTELATKSPFSVLKEEEEEGTVCLPLLPYSLLLSSNP